MEAALSYANADGWRKERKIGFQVEFAGKRQA
jgi:hypothetical protein